MKLYRTTVVASAALACLMASSTAAVAAPQESRLLVSTLQVSAPQESARIVIKDFMFRPATVTVKAGANITWVNEDDEPHTVRGDAGLFASGALDTSERFSFRFDRPGTYHFVCSIHPQMVGTVVVVQ